MHFGPGTVLKVTLVLLRGEGWLWPSDKVTLPTWTTREFLLLLTLPWPEVVSPVTAGDIFLSLPWPMNMSSNVTVPWKKALIKSRKKIKTWTKFVKLKEEKLFKWDKGTKLLKFYKNAKSNIWKYFDPLCYFFSEKRNQQSYLQSWATRNT